MMITEIPSPPSYSDIFLRQVINSLRHAIDSVRGKTVLDKFSRDHALHNAKLGLQHPQAWSCTRELLLLLAPIMEQAGWREDWIGFLTEGVKRAVENRDLEATGEYHYHLGMLCNLMADYSATEHHYRESADAFAKLQDAERQGRTLNRWAYAALNSTIQIEIALKLLEQAEILSNSFTERGYSCMVHGTIAIQENKAADMNRWFTQSLNYWEKGGSPRFIAWGLTNLGASQVEIQHYEESIVTLHRALECFDDIEDPAFQAVAHFNLGVAYYHIGNPTQAIPFYQEAISVFRRLNRGRNLAFVYNAVGKSYTLLQQWYLAHEAYQLAIEAFLQIQDVAQISNVMTNIAETYEMEGNSEKARSILIDAIILLDAHPKIPSYQFYRDMVLTDLDKLNQKL